MKKVLFFLICCLFSPFSGLNAQENQDSLRTIVMDGLTVKADRIIRKDGHYLLYPSKENKEFGTNALDAVSSMALFQTRINETSLLSHDRKEVFILINGVPSTAYDLRAYKGEEIKSVEYYAVAPPEYTSLTSGPVANIVMKKRYDRLYSGYANTSNAVNTGLGTNQLALTYSDSLNQVKVGYLIDYRNVGNISRQTNYVYSATSRSDYFGKKRYSGNYQNINASYQYYGGNHLFNAKVYSILNPAKENEPRTGTITTDGTEYNGSGTSMLKSNSTTTAVDLYYRYMLKQGRQFIVNVVNTFGKSHSESGQSLLSDGAQAGIYDYETRSRADNRSYSLIAHAVYASRLLGGSLSLSSRYEYKQLLQWSAGAKYKPYSHKEFLSAGTYWLWDNVTFYPTVGLDVFNQTSQDVSKTTVSPYFRLYTDWWGKGKAKGLSAQLTLTLNSVAPMLGDLTSSMTYLDRGLVSIGNAGLKSYWRGSAKLALVYFAPNSKNQVSFIVSPSYSKNKRVTTLVRSGDLVYLQPRNIGEDVECFMTLYGSWFPFKWLEFSPYMEYYYSNFNTPSQKVDFDYFRIGTSLVASFKNLSIGLYVNSPTKEYDGDLLSRGSLQYACTVQYKIKNWSIGAKYNYSGHNNYTSSVLPSFRYYDGQDWKPLHNLVRLDVTYTFSVGRSRRHDNRMLNETSNDNGLGKFNIPKNAE